MLSKIKKIEIDNKCVVKKTPIKVTQADVNRLNRKIAKEIKQAKEEQSRTAKIAEETLMR